MVTDCGPYIPRKNWIKAYWQKLIDLQKLPVIVIGTSKNKLKNCIDLRNEITIHESAALIKECRLFVGLDTAGFWFTKVFNKDALVINGGFSPPVCIEHNKSHHLFSEIWCSPCLKSVEECPYNKKCMKIITPKIVNEQIKVILEKNS